MTLGYEIDTKLKKLAPVLDDHAEWYNQLIRRVYYPEQYDLAQFVLQPPDTFLRWLSEAVPDEFMEKTVLESLRRIHDELHETGEKIVKVSTLDQKPAVKTFDSFADLYDGFIMQLRRLEQDVAQSDRGLDPACGLRSKKAMINELNQELERRSRRGRPFCLALARIDNFDRIKSQGTPDQIGVVLATVGALIRKCVRSFDDAYRSGEAEFVMCLKHSDISGGKAAVNRLRGLVDQENIKVQGGQSDSMPMTMSYCVAEPLPGDTLDELMNNMRADLERYKEDTGNSAVEYREQSPLQRLVKNIGAERKG